MFDGINFTGVRVPYPGIDWAFVDRVLEILQGGLNLANAGVSSPDIQAWTFTLAVA